MNTMRSFRATSLCVALISLSTLNSRVSTCLGQGALTPPGAPAPVMKSLDQIEARTAITNTASLITVSQPGSYYLTHNLTVSTGDAVDINANGVRLDLNGFTISSTAASASGNAILLSSGLKNISIANGFIQGGVTNGGSGVYNGSGFASGINYSGNVPTNVFVSKVLVSGCLTYGINLAGQNSSVVESCTVQTVGNTGISASTVKSSTAVDCGTTGIAGDQVSDCRGQSYGSGPGISGLIILNCTADCEGSGNGIQGTTLQNCYGSANGAGNGIFTGGTATGCYGFSIHGAGVSAFIANVCHGDSITGTPVNATHNVNSF